MCPRPKDISRLEIKGLFNVGHCASGGTVKEFQLNGYLA